MSRPVQSVQRAFRLLECLGRHKAGCGVRPLARETDLTPPTVLSLLKTMAAGGYVYCHTESRKYSLGSGLKALTRQIDEAGALKERIAPAMEALHRITKETTLAIGLNGEEARIVFHRRSSHALGVHHEEPSAILSRLATTHALLACQPTILRKKLVRDLARSTRERRELERRLRAAATAGHAEVVNHRNSGIAALALPVRESEAGCRVAIGLSVPVHRYGPAIRENLLQALHESVAHIRKSLGH